MAQFVVYDIPVCEQINSESGRRYKTPNGDIYPSVTTVLSSIPMPFIDNWRRKVGEETAKKISDAAAKRGSKIHGWCEQYLMKQAITHSPFEHEATMMFKNMKPELDKFDEVHALETRLWSDKLRVAGTVDCIAKIDGVFYIVDFKTSRQLKNRADIPSYFMQCAAYAVAWYERTGIAIAKMRVIITTQDYGVLVFDENVKDWVPQFIELRKKFDSL
jgi:genome maintenance exonuclease 1